MATAINIPATLAEQPGATLTLDAAGRWTATSVYHIVSTGARAAVALLPGTRHPRFAACRFAAATITELGGGLSEVRAEYEGKGTVSTEAGDENWEVGTGTTTAPVVGTDTTSTSGYVTDDDGRQVPVTIKNSAAADGSVTWDQEKEAAEVAQPAAISRVLTLSTSQEPLLTHPAFAALSDTEKEALHSIAGGVNEKPRGGLYKDDVTTAAGLLALDKIRQGITSYHVARQVWRVSFTNAKFPISVMGSVGKVMSPWGSPPALSGTANWLFEGGELEATGGAFTGTFTWIASGRTPWDSDLYT